MRIIFKPAAEEATDEKFNVHTGRAHKWGARSPRDKDSVQAQFGLPLELAPFLKLHTGSIIDFKKNNTSGGERSTCPIKTKKSLDLFKVGLILTVFFQTSWNAVLQASKVTVVGVCSALIPWNPICELISFIFINYRISRTNNPNLRARNLFLSNFWKMMQYDVEWILFKLTPTSEGPTDQPSRPTQRLDQSPQKASKAVLPSSQRALAHAWEGCKWDLSGTADCTTRDWMQDSFATRAFQKQSGWERGGHAGVQPRHRCPENRWGWGPSAAGDLQAWARTSHASGPVTWMGAVFHLQQT